MLSSVVFAPDVSPILMNGTPDTLLTLRRLPMLNGITDPSIVFVVLGFGTSTTVAPTRSTSYPLT